MVKMNIYVSAQIVDWK